jgi:acetyltransferase-like isoleucine patch superfamily enzyme
MIAHILNAVLSTRYKRWLAMYYPDRVTRTYFWNKTRVKFGSNSFAPLGMKVVDDQDDSDIQLVIGDRVSIAPNVIFVCKSCPDASEHLQNNSYVAAKLIKKKKIIIESDVWIGAGVVIMPGVTVHGGSIIGAGSVVLNDVASNIIVAGVPARFIRELEVTNL